LAVAAACVHTSSSSLSSALCVLCAFCAIGGAGKALLAGGDADVPEQSNQSATQWNEVMHKQADLPW